MSNIDSVLEERGARYGVFMGHAHVTQQLKGAMRQYGKNWHQLAADQLETLDMIQHKIGRILNGDPDYVDSWTDIIGYTRLVEARLIKAQAPKEPTLAEAYNAKLAEARVSSMGGGTEPIHGDVNPYRDAAAHARKQEREHTAAIRVDPAVAARTPSKLEALIKKQHEQKSGYDVRDFPVGTHVVIVTEEDEGPRDCGCEA